MFELVWASRFIAGSNSWITVIDSSIIKYRVATVMVYEVVSNLFSLNYHFARCSISLPCCYPDFYLCPLIALDLQGHHRLFCAQIDSQAPQHLAS
jgi:hypothetical protein